MSLTTRIQDQKDHITQVKKDLCSKVGIPKREIWNITIKKISIYFLKQIGIKT